MYKRQLATWFTEYGWPSTLRSDGGPQFRTEFSAFCADNGIKRELSSPYNPESNELAEAAVKNIKTLINRCHKLDEDCSKELTLWEAIGGRDNGLSYRPSLLSVICVMWLGPLKYNTIQYNQKRIC